ncbi:MAG: thiamine-phosphate kinase [Bacteroidetes bacterium]|nr:MAG: thiamine-phosphate kinase [Bacteroidota bacterium]PIE88366.1 MAG: thiamine-phosphate kinase [Bacteroidota bacterium]
MFEKREDKTPLSALGEFGLIDHLTKGITRVNDTTEVGVGDDCAVLNPSGKKMLITTDLLLENVHFDLSYTPLKHLGYKAVAVNLSDIVAMMGKPEQVVVSIAVSSKFTVEAVDEIYKGINLCCKRYGVDLVGGDTTTSTSGLMISISAVGVARDDAYVLRSGAQQGDLVCLSGDVGASYMGLLLLQREKEVWKANPRMQPDLAGYDYILERHLKPEPRTDIVKLLQEHEVQPTSMIDVSDGVASEILHLCKQSKKGCTLYEEKLPIDPQTISLCESFKMNPVTAAMNGGEDYELLFTIAQKDYPKIEAMKEIAVIGHMTEEASGAILVSHDNVVVPIEAQGWNHLK